MSRLASIFSLGLFLAVASCGGDDGGGTPDASTAPKITGCNSVSYKGCTFGNLGCAPGIASFDIDTSFTSGGMTCSASFHITCTQGCIATVTVK